MKRVIFGFLALSGLCAQAAAQTGRPSVATTPAAQTTATNAVQAANYHKFGPTAHHFMLDWKDCQAAAQTAQSAQAKAVQGTAKAPSDVQLAKLQDNFGMQLLPVMHATANTNKAKTNAYAFYVPAFVSFSNEEALQEATRHGLIVQTQLKTMATALILPDSLEAVANLTHINRIEVASKAQITLDTAKVPTRVREVHLGGVRYGQMPDQTSEAYKGEGVVVGIVDLGFDFTHPTFFDAVDATLYRVKQVWDQRATASDALKPPTGKNYGVEYAGQDQILAAQHCAGTGSHGSHVAGIAGGSGAGTSFVGMAPKSDLVFVPTTMYSTAILDGVKYILDYAKSQKKPCVVNLSLGSHVGPHDGTSDFDRACDELKQDGFVLVGSAGNEGRRALYLQHTFTANTADTVVMSYLDFSSTSTALDIWGDSIDHFTAQLRLTDGDGTIKSSISVSSDSRSNDYRYLIAGSDTLCKVYCWSTLNATNHKTNIYFNIDAEKWNKFKTGENKLYADYKLNVRVVSQNKQRTTSAQMWLNNGNFTKGGFTDPRLKEGSNSHTVGETGGSGRSIISVGAYESRMWWKSIDNKSYRYPDDVMGEIAGFSSRGPTADGRMKPDITAPGCVLISAFNSFDNSQSNQMKVKAVQKNNKDYHFGVMQGTSMSAPAAAGIIALWLQVDSTLDVDDVKQILQNTALPHPDAGKPNAAYTWGYGKIDAAAGVQYLLKKTLPNEPEPLRVYTDSVFVADSSATLYMSHTADTGHNFGFYYHTSFNVKEGKSVSVDINTSSAGWAYAHLYPLQPNTTYYYKAFGLQTLNNGQIDTVWGETKSFKTLSLIQRISVSTWNPQNITDTSATLYLSINGGEAQSLGFFYHTQADVKSGKRVNAVRDNNRGENVYKADIRQLEPNRSYFCKAFAVVEGDTVYGGTISFKAKDERTDTLIVITLDPTDITDTSATLRLFLQSGDTSTAIIGFYYHTQSDVQNGYRIITTNCNDADSIYTATIHGLKADRYYFVKAFGVWKNGRDSVNGKLFSFKTLKPSEKPDSLAIEEALTVGRLLVYPNPVAKEGEFVVELPLEAGLGGAASGFGLAASGAGLNAGAAHAAYVLTITNLSGKTIQTLPMTQRQVVVHGLSSGVYLLQVESRKSGAEAAKIYQAKVVVQ